ncbi:alpha/beta fold hydrolase [Allorhizobium sp. BGMRC 0089]|uniref:alpha/beta hydrolase family protein n=1 Tax=Allorhizobium sonneratiae TaxID=2934936 RepID=UPI00203409EE|nr:alpha/beta fold hydrolase [Allorhizobium sonneratiae]MCM2291061.1 alpha/beta fold hydrolase [Allorhizobium sonneratiae]
MRSVFPSQLLLSRRSLLGGFAASLAAPSLAEAFAIPAEPPLKHLDYRKAREHFHTRLVEKGPAPDNYETLETPANARRIFYRSGRGGELDLIAWVSNYKRSKKSKPAVLFLHGGNAMGRGQWEPLKAYIDAGYVVMMPTMRGENGQMGIFSGFYDEVSDVLAAAERLAHLPGVDDERVFLAGHSVGGTLALLASMTSRRFRASVPVSGASNAWLFFDRYQSDIRFDVSNPHEFSMRSPVCYAHSFKCPTLILQANSETRLADQNALLLKRAKGASVPVTSNVLNGTHMSEIPDAVAASISFFKKIAA